MKLRKKADTAMDTQPVVLLSENECLLKQKTTEKMFAYHPFFSSFACELFLEGNLFKDRNKSVR